MNKPNHFYPNEVNRPKHFYRDIHETRSNDRTSITYSTTSPSSSYYFPTPPIYGNHRSQFTSPPDSGICDGMNNCHLADSWVNYMNQHTNLPITQITNQIPILNSYMPSPAVKFHPTAFTNQFHHHAVYHKNYLESIYERQKSIDAANVSANVSHPQQQLLCAGFTRRAELNYVATTNDYQINKSETIHDNNSASQCQSKENNEISDDDEEAKMCIKFQDRNKKLDFKKNFRDENRKINGCFYDSENDLSPRMRSEASCSAAAPPPKKKWIKNYMTAFAGIFGI
jgi:hypothetical protein